MSKAHEANPFVLRAGGEEYRVGYVPWRIGHRLVRR
jgi:hypothetical protein